MTAFNKGVYSKSLTEVVVCHSILHALINKSNYIKYTQNEEVIYRHTKFEI